MADSIFLDLVTPERRLISADVSELTAKALAGNFQVLPGHANYITLLDVGELSFTEAGKKRFVCVSGGFAEVTLDQGIRIMAEAAEFAEEIDISRAKNAQDRALACIGTFDHATQAKELQEVEDALKRALARISVAQKVPGE